MGAGLHLPCLNALADRYSDAGACGAEVQCRRLQGHDDLRACTAQGLIDPHVDLSRFSAAPRVNFVPVPGQWGTLPLSMKGAVHT